MHCPHISPTSSSRQRILSLSPLLLLCLFQAFVTAQNLPPPITAPSSARFGSRFYIAGGGWSTGKGFTSDTSAFYYIDLGVAWDKSSPVWGTLSEGPKDRLFTSAFSNDGKTMAAFNGGGILASLYNVSSNQWYSSTARLTNGFEKLVTAVTDPATGLIYIAGATNNRTQMVVYNPAQDSVNLLYTPPQGVRNWTLYRAVWSPQTSSILYHGGDNREDPDRFTNSIVQYTPAKDEWKVMQTTGSRPPERVDFCMAVDEEGSRLVVFAGRNAKSPTELLRDLYILDLKTWVWTQGRPYPIEERLYHTCTIVGSTFFSWGGENLRGTVARPAILYNLDTFEYLDTFNPNSSSTPPSKMPLIVGSTVGLVGIASLIVGVSWYFRTKKKRAASVNTLLEEEEDESKEQNKAFIPGNIGLEPRSSYAYQPVQASYAEGVSTESIPNQDHQNSSDQRRSGHSQTQPLVNPNQGHQSFSTQHYSGLNQLRPPVNPQCVPYDQEYYYDALEDLRSPQQLQSDIGDPQGPHQLQQDMGNLRSPHLVHHNMEGPRGPQRIHHSTEDSRGFQQMYYSLEDPRGPQQMQYSLEDPRGPQQIYHSMQYP